MSTSNDFAASAQALAASVLASANDPADALRLLIKLADFTPVPLPSTAPIGMAIQTAQTASGDLFRRAAVVALARASATYQPSSYNDAIRVRDTVFDLLADEALIAADQGEDATYEALRALQMAVVQDLTARGANLATIETYNLQRALPAIVLAQRLYRDAARADELTLQADPIHPAFMPGQFQALSR